MASLHGRLRSASDTQTMPTPNGRTYGSVNLASSGNRTSGPRSLRSGAGSGASHEYFTIRRTTSQQNGVTANWFDEGPSSHDTRSLPHNEPPHRAGLLRPRSSTASFSTMSSYNPNVTGSRRHSVVVPHSQHTIRPQTMQLSMLFSPQIHDPSVSDPHAPHSFQEQGQGPAENVLLPPLHTSPFPSRSSSIDLSTSTSSFSTTHTNGNNPINLPPPFTQAQHLQSSTEPSGLSLTLARRLERERQEYEGEDGEIVEEPQNIEDNSTPTPTMPKIPLRPRGTSIRWELSIEAPPDSNSTEVAPLLNGVGNALGFPRYCSVSQASDYINPYASSTLSKKSSTDSLSGLMWRAADPENFKTAVKSLPAVLLGCLLNILDGISYGMIIFPTTGAFVGLGPMGVSMFFVSTLIAQLTYSLGGSGFAGANGSMMIEVVPFFHVLATSIAREIGEEHPREIIVTTLAAYTLSSILTGLTFFLLGTLKLGVIIGFFPRHILVGCIGGVGAFLIETGLTVSMRIDDDDFTMTLDTFKFMFLDPHNLALWVIPLALALLLRVITHKYHHQLIFPLYFIAVPLLFYIIITAAQLDLGELRRAGWLFDIGSGGHEPWYKFYSYFDYGALRFGPLWSTLPTQFALLFFNTLHPPLNVPALAVSLNDDVDTNKELVAHGYSNLLAGVFGTIPNYLAYVNTLLFYRVGGSTRIAGFMLAVATAALLVLGTGPIAYIPVMVVGALIFVLGIDLVKEALWDTRHRVSKTEYITIATIMICMTVWDFVVGVLFGIIASCFFFVVQNSQHHSIRAFHTGETAMSTVRRPGSQRAYIREVSKQTTILRLQGFLFFGTITYVEEAIRDIIEGEFWYQNPVRFLVLDLSLVAGVDMSSAEAFVRIQRLLSAKRVTLVFCGFSASSPVGQALQSVDVLGADGVELCSTFNDAMEWTENAYLRAWFRAQKPGVTNFALPGRQEPNIAYQSMVGSVRRSLLQDAGNRILASDFRGPAGEGLGTEPYNTLVKAFSSYGDFVSSEQFRPIAKYLERQSVPSDYVLWNQGDPSDGLYIIESGVLRATYQLADYTQSIEESMVAGTLAGELSALSDLPRNATVVVEHPAVLWKLSIDNLRKLEVEEPALARIFVQIVLKAAKVDYDILLSALALRL